MGNADLRQISSIEEIEYDSIAGKTVAVDAHNWLYKYITTVPHFTTTEYYTRSDGVELPNLIGITRGLKRFVKHNIEPVFVFDGTAHELKQQEIQSRKEAKQWAEKKSRNASTKIEKAKYDSYSQRLTPEIITTTLELMKLFGVSHFTAPQNAEAQASKMASNGDVQYVISDDYDTILFGSPRTIRNFTSSSRPLEELSLEKTLKNHQITQEQLIGLALLCGTDYNDGVHGVGTKTGLKYFKKHGTLDKILKEENKEIENKDTLIDIFTNPNVSSDYPAPSPISPDIDAVRKFIADNGIKMSEVETALEEIEQKTQQTGLSNWT